VTVFVAGLSSTRTASDATAPAPTYVVDLRDGQVDCRYRFALSCTDIYTEGAMVVSVRYMVDDVDAAVAFYTEHFGFTTRMQAGPAFAEVVRGDLRLLLSGPESSAGRVLADGARPGPGGWNRIHFVVDDLQAEIERLAAEGIAPRNPVVAGPGGAQVLFVDPAGNLVELFQPGG
jgi:catechol 2,3-dioxygenase-like lactoylglutathione lyase family enzyme